MQVGTELLYEQSIDSEYSAVTAHFGESLQGPFSQLPEGRKRRKLRKLCGDYIKSAYFMLTGADDGQRHTPPRLRVCNEEPCSYRAMCESYAPALESHGNISVSEMRRTFNCGVGMIVAVDHDDAHRTIEILEQCGETAWKIGEIVAGAGPVEFC